MRVGQVWVILCKFYNFFKYDLQNIHEIKTQFSHTTVRTHYVLFPPLTLAIDTPNS